ncbi:MAG: hypothetical protein L6R42_005637, partial [Xanthoria sp. 1 TBL-2021]
LGKSPPKITKRSKKPDAASRPYRIHADIQDQSDSSDDSSDSQPQRPIQQANSPPTRKRKNDRLQDTASKRSIRARSQAPPSRGPIIGKRPLFHVPGPHLITDTKTGESIWLPAEPDNPTDLPKWHLEKDINPFTGEPPPIFQQKPVEELYQEILECPDLRFDHRGIEELLADAQPRTLEEITQCYHDLRSAAWKWAKEGFQYESSSPLNLMELATSHPELMEYINSTTASPQLTDWETLLQKKRAAIVYSILGKVLDIHVFGEELFGASPEQKYTLRSSDRESMDDDGFARQQTRASTLTALLPHPHTLPPHTLPALQTLQGQLVSLLSPLLPPSTTHPLNTPLFALLLSATNLALAIRTNPHEIYYLVSAPSPGSAYDKEAMAALNAVDVGIAEGVEGVREMRGKGGIRFVVGVGGWSGLVAYWPICRDGDGVGVGEKGRKGMKKEEMGVQTQVIARADVWVVLEAVNPSAQKIAGMGKGKGRNTLRAKMWDRSLCAEIDKEIKKLKTKRRVGVAAAVAVVGGYFFAGDCLREVLWGESLEAYGIRQRDIW